MSYLPRVPPLPVRPDQEFDELAEQVRDRLRVPCALVSLASEQGQALPGAAGLPEPWQSIRWTPLSHSLSQFVVQAATMLAVADARVDPRTAGTAAVEDLRTVAWAGVPLWGGAGADGSGVATPAGALCAVAHQPRDWTEADLVQLSDLAEEASARLRSRLAGRAPRQPPAFVSGEAERAADIADTAARLVQTARRAVQQARTVQRTARELGRSPDRHGALVRSVGRVLTAADGVDEITAALVEVAGTEVGAIGCELLLVDGDGRVPAADRDLDPDSWNGMDVAAAAAAAARQNRAFFLPTAAAAWRLFALAGTRPSAPRPGAAAVLPLVIGSEPLGAMVVRWPGARDFDPAARAELRALGRYVSHAVARAQVVRQRHSIVEVFQRALRTALPSPADLGLAARYLPAAADDRVGGDWYDAVVLPDGVIAVVIGDVAGHDIAAAAAMSQLRAMLRAYAYDGVSPPAEILRRVDRAGSALQPDTLATLVLVRVESAGAGGRLLRWTNAGHPPPVLLHPDGRTELLQDRPELLLGVDPSTTRTDHEHALPVGSTLLLYTDGLIERRGQDLDDGIARLRDTLTELADLPLDALLDQLLDRLVPGRREDDCAVIALRPRRPVSRAGRAAPAAAPSRRR
jgi:serine phosphatase RsbU (regulator of sigma subunit)